LAAFGMVRALHRSSPSDEPTLYLSIGGLTNLAVAQGANCLFTRVIGGGIEAIAVELAERRGLTLDQARGWIARVGLDDAVEDVDGDLQIVEDARTLLANGARRIATDVRHSLDFHQAQGGEARVERAVLTGPAASVPGFAEALSAELGLSVVSGVVGGSTAGVDAGCVTVAAGLAVQEVER
jgi:type IV pilus assembly protein PilM